MDAGLLEMALLRAHFVGVFAALQNAARFVRSQPGIFGDADEHFAIGDVLAVTEVGAEQRFLHFECTLAIMQFGPVRSEERRVGKECRAGWWRGQYIQRE